MWASSFTSNLGAADEEYVEVTAANQAEQTFHCGLHERII